MKNDDYHQQTHFLQEVLQYDGSPEAQDLKLRFTEAQREERCLRSAIWGVSRLAALALAGLAYARLLLEDFFEHNNAHLFLNLLFVVAAGSLVCLLNYVGLWIIYRRNLNRLREESRRLIAEHLRAHLGHPDVGPVSAS